MNRQDAKNAKRMKPQMSAGARRLRNSASQYVEPLNQKQVEILRGMTGEQRLLIALDLCRSVWRIAAQGVKYQYPGISDTELKAKLKERILR